jgi:hypothetical protein
MDASAFPLSAESNDVPWQVQDNPGNGRVREQINEQSLPDRKHRDTCREESSVRRYATVTHVVWLQGNRQLPGNYGKVSKPAILSNRQECIPVKPKKYRIRIGHSTGKAQAVPGYLRKPIRFLKARNRYPLTIYCLSRIYCQPKPRGIRTNTLTSQEMSILIPYRLHRSVVADFIGADEHSPTDRLPGSVQLRVDREYDITQNKSAQDAYNDLFRTHTKSAVSQHSYPLDTQCGLAVSRCGWCNLPSVKWPSLAGWPERWWLGCPRAGGACLIMAGPAERANLTNDGRPWLRDSRRTWPA